MKRRILIFTGVLPLVLVWTICMSRRPNDPFAALRVALPHDSRPVEPRLTGGFRWAPFHATDDPHLRVAAGDILDRERKTGSRDSSHAAAVAEVLIGHPSEAINALAGARTAPELNDLAAASYILSSRADEAANLTRGLSAVDRALELDPLLPEARFNRALLIERLGLRDAAREAWQACLEVDSKPGWADEVRSHIARLSQPPPQFREILQRMYDGVSDESARKSVAEFPQESRTWGETEILGRWGAAYLAGNSGEAAQNLAIARILGRAVRQQSGEVLLSEAVDAIDRCAAQRRAQLAEAHALYRRGRIEYGNQNAIAAEPLLRDAIRKFEANGSPMQFVGRYYMASAKFDQNHIDEARRDLDSLTARIPSRFMALHAQIGWAVGLCAGAAGDFGGAIEAWIGSASQFQQLGERLNAASVEGLLADVHDAVGAFDASRKERIAAIRALGQNRSSRLATVLSGASRTAIRQRDWAAASAFLRIEVEAARATGPAQLLADTLLRRAYVRQMLGKRMPALSDVENAQRVIGKMTDAAQRARGNADAAWTRALLILDEKPAEAVRLLTVAMEFHTHRGRRSFLPDLYLSRARAHLRASERENARSDFRSGIECIEAERRATPISERLGLFDTVNELFDEAVALELDAGDIPEAFRLVGQSRARTLLDIQRKTYRPVLPADIEKGTTLIEYVLLKNKLVIFTANRGGVRAKIRAIEDYELEANVVSFRFALEHADARTAQRVGTWLYDLLIGSDRIADDRLVIVPSGSLERLPFAALVSTASRRYLLEEHTIVMAPSAETLLGAQQRSPDRRNTLLAISDPRRDDTPRLDASIVEVKQIALWYPTAKVLSGLAATREAFTTEAPVADVIHYSGHAAAGQEEGEPALLLSNSHDSGRMGANEIAAMNLRASVVVLAGCATARGEVRKTDGTASLARAFLAAGTRSVVATLWPIDDEQAAPFFARLHQALKSGARPSEALRSVQLEAIRSEAPRRQTFLWAAIQSIGN